MGTTMMELITLMLNLATQLFVQLVTQLLLHALLVILGFLYQELHVCRANQTVHLALILPTVAYVKLDTT